MRTTPLFFCYDCSAPPLAYRFFLPLCQFYIGRHPNHHPSPCEHGGVAERDLTR